LEVTKAGSIEQHGNDLRGMLKVRVHDTDPPTSSRAKAVDDSSAETALSLIRRPAQQQNGGAELIRHTCDHTRRLIVAIVDEQDLVWSIP
jgi:hypothetical protein